MRKAIFAVLAMLATVLVPAANVGAAQPTVVEDFTINEVFEIPAGALCDFPITVDQTIDIRVTVFTDKNGDETVRVKVNGTVRVSGPGGSLIDRFRVNETIASDGTLTLTGNRNNRGGTGIINGSGRVIVDLETGELISSSGPIDDFENFPAVCGAL